MDRITTAVSKNVTLVDLMMILLVVLIMTSRSICDISDMIRGGPAASHATVSRQLDGSVNVFILLLCTQCTASYPDASLLTGFVLVSFHLGCF